MGGLTMARTRMMAGRCARLRFAFLFLAGFLTTASVVSAQYPSKSQVGKDGTTVLLEDYANPPLSSMTHGMAPPPATDFKGQLSRMNALRSEPANAPLANSRFFVDDQNGTLYILDKAAKKFTP